MRNLAIIFLSCCAMNSWAAPSTKELAKEASRLEQLANQETDPAKQQELREKACEAWSAAYDAGQKIEYQLFIGACKQQLQDLEGAEMALKTFLAQAAPDHKDRPIAEQALAQVVAKRQAAKQETTSPALTLAGPVPIQESKTQWKRKAIFAGSTLAGLGLVGGAIAFGVLRAQEPSIPQGQGGTAVEIP